MLALVYDVHGNLPALHAVLEDATSQGAERFLLGGDYALFGPWPAETVTALKDIPNSTWIRGNVDRWTAFPDQAPDDDIGAAVAACREAVGHAAAAALGELPTQAVLDGTVYCHASPVSDMESFLPQPAADEDRLLGGASAPRIVFGHTHLQFRRTRADGIELLNPGSVGIPLDGDHRAAYALASADGTVELRRVAYDHQASATALRERFGEAEWVLRTERRLRSAQP